MQLYVDGAWRAYVLDDQLPMRRDPATGHARLAFGRPCDAPDLWLPLLEKAVAKSLGGYHLLPAIGVVEALGLLAGAVGEELHLAPPSGPPAELEAWRAALWEKLVAWLSEGRTIGAWRRAQGGGGGGGDGGGGRLDAGALGEQRGVDGDAALGRPLGGEVGGARLEGLVPLAREGLVHPQEVGLERRAWSGLGSGLGLRLGLGLGLGLGFGLG